MEDHNLSAEDAAKLSHIGRKYFKFIEFDADESLVTEIRKHPIGLFFIYITGIGIALIIAIVFGIIAMANSSASLVDGTGVSSNTVETLALLIGGLFLLFILVAMTIQAILYVNNVIFVTSEKIAQVLYVNLFHRKISQLSIGDVQDVTVTQKGILAHFFNYGTLVIETAGEQQNYTFTYIPDPYVSSKKVVGAHEQNLKQFGN